MSRLPHASVLCVAAALAAAFAPTVRGTPGPQDKTPALKGFTQKIPGSEVAFEMVAIPGGTFVMGSPAGEKGRKEDEGPQRKVTIRPFWIGKCEVTWDEYDLWSTSPKGVDGVTRPTPPYVDMTFGMGDGRSGYPAICMTQKAANTYCEWLSKVTGRKYRLPTEAEWEYACRAGTTTAYSFGDGKLDDHGWYADNAEEEYHKVGKKKPNAWGLHDMHGNVAEWVLDQHAPYKPGDQDNPLVEPKTLYPRVVRGGSWVDKPPVLRSAARVGSHEDWKAQDPQIPKSVWYHTDADYVGFRVVCEWQPEGTGKDAPAREAKKK